ncbi:hypothetical protein [Rhizobium tubonense]|uniref:Uncharacterized protein n=1 Tax=Rhizobium tubonense TaxID=484088 RepID=A0A2W4C9B8_9HYPH|nr:hypothetical protein [Rhizobium tubonense]PZM09979.1 hypothetical protein CPY51_24275 [Rhizobium tubonense]
MKNIDIRLLALLPAFLFALGVIEIGRLSFHHRWISQVLVPGFWALLFGFLVYCLFIWVSSQEEEF